MSNKPLWEKNPSLKNWTWVEGDTLIINILEDQEDILANLLAKIKPYLIDYKIEKFNRYEKLYINLKNKRPDLLKASQYCPRCIDFNSLLKVLN